VNKKVSLMQLESIYYWVWLMHCWGVADWGKLADTAKACGFRLGELYATEKGEDLKKSGSIPYCL